MNAKEEVLQILKYELKYGKIEKMDYYRDLITAVENAIFDVPSEEEIDKESYNYLCHPSNIVFKKGCNFILNYKKPESDGK